MPPLPQGGFRFVALDVETANRDRSSICQIGLAFVHPGVAPANKIETWSCYIDPATADWSCSWVHGITAQTVLGAPSFAQVIEILRPALQGLVIYQHSGFDRSAIGRASLQAQLPAPDWEWRDSVIVARKAWPQLKGRGGHGLASLKDHLGLSFVHHDAGEDARAAALVVLHAEAKTPVMAG
ncbi:exonuclease domain-containing protein [Thioclava sp. GXIMD4216]|uniref:Exonuclease domain-containing protein n=1 Tax=Thioclava litoralis TaxID=3076557 RepID=A0ABZ1E6E5_9RHOB|nr:exonuclease domain-containing protein [Thioclava sp. FTW29]